MARFDLVHIDGKGAIRVGDKAAVVAQIVELHRRAQSVRFARSEPDAPETGGEVGGVERAFQRFREHALVDHVLNGKEAGDVGLRFLERAVGFLQLFAHGRFAAVHRHVVRAKSVHQFVHHGVGEEGVE